jgi:hypothetical protein
MYFNLRDLPDATAQVRPPEFYLEKSRPLLALPNPMVIFCDLETRHKIEDIRNELAPGYLTSYIEKSITEYDFYKLNHPIIKNNRKSGSGYFNDARNTPSYFITTVFKIIALQIAEQRNDFNSTHYAWIDFGLSHLAPDNFQNAAMALLKAPRSRISLVYIHYRSSEELKNMNNFLTNFSCGTASSVMTVEREYVSKFYTAVMSIFYEQLLKGMGHAEEQIITYCYDRHPELFTLIYGDYYSQLTNYHNPVRDYPAIKQHFIKNAIAANRIDLAKDAIKALLKSVDSGLINIDPTEVAFLRKFDQEMS